MGIAPLVAARRKPLHWMFATTPAALPAGTVPIQGASDPIGLKVEIFVNSAWQDISSFVYYRNPIRISRGKPNETGQAQPQTATLTLNNRDGRFSPRNPAGPYYGSIGRNTPLRVSRTWNGVRWFRFHGEVPAWPTTSEISNTDIYTTITASGPLRRLNQGTPTAASAIRRSMTSPLRYGEQNVVAYWPLEDGSNATRFASGINGQPAMTIVNAGVTPASNTNFHGSSPTLVMNAGTVTANVPPYTVTGQTNSEWLMFIPSGGTGATRNLATFYTSGSAARWVVQVDSSGDLILTAYSASGSSILAPGPFAFGVNGQYVGVNLQWTQVGANINYSLIVTYFAPSQSSYFNFSELIQSGTLNGNTAGGVLSVLLGDSAGLGATGMGHLAIGNQITAFSDGGNAAIGWVGEPVFIADATAIPPPTYTLGRFVRLCTEQGINGSEVYGTVYSGDVTTMGEQLPQSYASLLQQCADTEMALLYEPVDQVGVALRSRLSLYNQAPTLTLDYAQNQLSSQLEPLDDDTYTRNDVTVQRIGGSSAVAVQTSGTLNTQQPPGGVGDYATSVSISLGDDTQPVDQAAWRLHLGTVDEPRYPAVSVNLRHQQFTGNTTLMNQALTTDIGDRIAINNPPAWLPPDAISQLVQGYQETLGIWEHDITFNGSPESPYRIAVLDDPVLSRADTDGSTLVASLSTILNGNPSFTDGNGNPRSTGWSSFGAVFTIIGTSGASVALPPGGPTGFGAKVTVNGAGGPGIFGNAAGNIFQVTGGTTYYTSAQVYYPTALNTMFVGINWYDVNLGFISTSFTDTVVTANTWTALTSGVFTPPATAVWGGPVVGLSGTSTNGDVYYTTNSVTWSGAVSVATTNSSSPLWTTAAGDFPFDVNVGGERMTVTAISGSSSPQTFTVARSINGVVKPQVAGTDVRLQQPMILSL